MVILSKNKTTNYKGSVKNVTIEIKEVHNCNMDFRRLHNINVSPAIEAYLGTSLLLCACIIYLLFRSPRTNLYKWCCYIGVSDALNDIRSSMQGYDISAFVKYSLPDGLYCAAYILIINAIWHDKGIVMRPFLIALIPLIAICSEFFQYFGLMDGTFDWFDIFCDATPLVLFYFLAYPKWLIKQ